MNPKDEGYLLALYDIKDLLNMLARENGPEISNKLDFYVVFRSVSDLISEKRDQISNDLSKTMMPAQ